ncbi:MAG: hypothetical protein AB1421_07230 [Pseudomonadota bacterium]
MELESFSQRLLNPFRGVQRVMRYGAAEAVTLDGHQWDIYVSNDELLEGLDCRQPVLVSDIRFGRWSPDKGLKRGPLYPSADFRRMERVGAALYEALVSLHDQPVFPFKDRYELWLLDGAGLPLALLASVLRAEEMELDLPLQWQPGLDLNGGLPVPECVELGKALAEQVNALAGERPRAAWCCREPDGSGVVLAGINLPKDRLGQRWKERDFPAFFLGQAAGHGEQAREQVRLRKEFHAWLAPCLLLWPGWDRESRRWLETQARSRAEAVDRWHRLYPEEVDASMVQAARVEAMLRRAQPRAPQEQRPTLLSTFYIELDQDLSDPV